MRKLPITIMFLQVYSVDLFKSFKLNRYCFLKTSWCVRQDTLETNYLIIEDVTQDSCFTIVLCNTKQHSYINVISHQQLCGHL